MLPTVTNGILLKLLVVLQI